MAALTRIYILHVLVVLTTTLCARLLVYAADEPQPIEIIPSDGFNLVVDDQIDAHYVIVKLATPTHNWFAGTFVNLPTDKEITIGLSMQDNNGGINAGNVGKWVGLKPVFTYADPTQYQAYECFIKDAQGRWVSDDLAKMGQDKFAGTGKVPAQTAIPREVAEQFLSADGKSWQPWREVDNAEAVVNLNIFRIKQKFSFATATVAMRVPYTYTYLQAYLDKLKAARFSGVMIDELGVTAGKRKIQVIRIEDARSTAKADETHTILAIAREHATEHASSWPLQGMLNLLLSDTPEAARLRKNTTWLVVPIEDPDGSADAVFDRLCDDFRSPYGRLLPREIPAYLRHFTEYINQGHSIDYTISLHNVEASESANLFCPIIHDLRLDDTIAFNKTLFAALNKQGYLTGNPEKPWQIGELRFRLYAWCSVRFGSFDLCYEVNDRYPPHRLSLAQTQALGRMLAMQLGEWRDSPAGQRCRRQVKALLQNRAKERAAYFARQQRTPEQRTLGELFVYGY